MRLRLAIGLSVLAASAAALAAAEGVSIETWGDAYPQGDPAYQAWYRMAYTASAQPHPKVFFRVAAMLESDSHGEISRDVLYDGDDRDLKRAAMRLRDLAVGFRGAGFTVTLGRQRLTWGRTSFINATDNLSPRDWTDPLDEVRLSPWSADLAWERGRWHAEGALVARYAPSRLPQLGSRWFPTDPDTEVTWGSSAFPEATWSTVQAAARGGYRGSAGEATLSYYRGYDDAPRLIARVGPPDPVTFKVPVTLDRRFPKLEVAGADGEVLLGSWALRGEAGYFHYPEGLDDGYGIVQVEAEWSRAAWRIIAGYGDTIGENVPPVASTSLDQAFLPAVFFYVARGEATEWQVALDATMGTKDFDTRVRLSGSYPFAGHVRAGGEIDVIGGGSGTFWGRWRANDRLRLFIKFDF